MQHLKVINPSECFLCYRLSERDDKLRAVCLDGTHRIDVVDGHATIKTLDARICFRKGCSVQSTPGKVFQVHEHCVLLLVRLFDRAVLFDRTIWDLGVSLASDMQLSKRRKEEEAKIWFRESFAMDGVFFDKDGAPYKDPTHPYLLEGVSKLPAELRLRIADDAWPCLHQYPALILSQVKPLVSLLRSTELRFQRRLTEFNPGDAIEYTYIEIGGVRYISGIHQISGAPRKGTPPETLIVYKGERGITEIQFLKDGQNAAPCKGLSWYKVYRHFVDPLQIRLKPLLVEDIIPRGLDQAFSTWDTPNPPNMSVDRMFCHLSPSAKSGVRMKYVDLRNNVAGITVCCRFGGMVSCTPWTENGFLPQPEDFPGLVYIFLPFQEREKVSRVWVRDTRDRILRRPILSIQMSSGKYHTLGPYVPPSHRSAYLFHSLQDPDDGHISALCFNDLGVASSVRDLVVAVECPMAPRRRTCPDPPWPSDLNGPGGAPGYEWYYSEAELVGACSLRTCTDSSHPECPVIGVLVSYQDGTTKVLGQWRVDKASNSPRYAVSENEHLHWTMASYNALSHVKELFICDNNCPDDASSVCITMSGRLFWWFSSSASVLHHEVF